MNTTILWIVLAVVIVAAVVWFVASRSRARRLERQRAEAAELRDSTAEHHLALREQEATAAAAQAQAHQARAEAEQRAAEAQRLEVEADRRRIDRDEAREVSAEQLRKADALDPDVATDAHGNRLDAEENRLDEDGNWLDADRDRLDADRDRLDHDGATVQERTNGLAAEHNPARDPHLDSADGEEQVAPNGSVEATDEVRTTNDEVRATDDEVRRQPHGS